MNLEKEMENILLVVVAVIAIAFLINVIGSSYTGYSIYNYTGNETSYEIISHENYDKILTSYKGVIDYDIINNGNGESEFSWKSENGLIIICDSDEENCSKELNESNIYYWYLSRNFSEIKDSGEKSVIEWINEESKTKKEFWVSFEDTPIKKSDSDFNDIFFEIQKKMDSIMIKLEHQQSGYKNPTNLLFRFDSQLWFVKYKISKHLYLGGNKWNDSDEEILEWTGDLDYKIVYDDSKEGQWIEFEFADIIDSGDEDNDTIINEDDNCIDLFNPDQNDSDEDSFGDMCDNCPFVSNEDQLDSNNNSIGNICEPSCNENWTCSEWSECIDGNKTRICNDTSLCGTEMNKPDLTEYCNISIGNETNTTLPENQTNVTAPAAPSSSGGGGGGSSKPKEETRTLEQAKEITIPETTRILEKKEDLCTNRIKDPDEKEIDCGGSCPDCVSIKTVLPYTNYMLFVLMVMVILTLLDKGRAGMIEN